MDDRTLVQKILAGDEKAERYFFETYRPKLLRIANYILGFHDSDAEDVVQESLVVAFREFPRYEHRGTLAAWLRRICAHRCFERIRERRRHLVGLDGDMETLARSASVARSAEADDRALRDEQVRVLRREWDALEEACRSILRMREEERQSYAEIADKLKVPIGTVMSRLARCKEALKERVRAALKTQENTDG